LEGRKIKMASEVRKRMTDEEKIAAFDWFEENVDLPPVPHWYIKLRHAAKYANIRVPRLAEMLCLGTSTVYAILRGDYRWNHWWMKECGRQQIIKDLIIEFNPTPEVVRLLQAVDGVRARRRRPAAAEKAASAPALTVERLLDSRACPVCRRPVGAGGGGAA